MRTVVIAFFMLVAAIPAMSQGSGVRINAYSNYIFSDHVDSYYDANNYYNGYVKDGFQWGVGAEFMVRPEMGVELSYQREDTKAALKNYKYPLAYHDYDLAVNYIMVSGTRYFRKPGGRVEAFGGLGAGLGIFNAKDPVDGSTTNLTKFSWQLRAGAIIWASDAVGLRLQAQLQSAVQAIGGGIYVGTGGAGAGVSSYSTIYQFGLGGGLVFKLHGQGAGKKK
jgi:opacity protein-like surface antigen